MSQLERAFLTSILDPYISRFSSRYAYKAVDPCSFLAVVSPAQQCKPKSQAISPLAPDHLPRDGRDYRDHPQVPPTAPANGRTGSPKRPANEELSDSSEHQRPRKLHRPDSPLKGAAGRRLDQQKRAQQQQQQQMMQGRDRNIPDRDDGMHRGGLGRGGYQQNQRQPQHQPQQIQMHQPPAPAQLPDLIMYLLSILPGADKYQAARFRPEAMVGLLGNINLPRDVQANNRESTSHHRSAPQGPKRKY